MKKRQANRTLANVPGLLGPYAPWPFCSLAFLLPPVEEGNAGEKQRRELRCLRRITSTSVLGHFGLWSLRSFLKGPK